MPTSEHQLQSALCNYLDLSLKRDLDYFAIPNGGLRNIRVAASLKAEGVKRGVPDICIMLPYGRVGWMELKTTKGRQSLEQKGFEARCARIGHPYALVRSIDDAQAALMEWGALK
jgi:hypothetical protein